MAVPTLPGLSLLRLVRVVRVVKLFKQMQSLKIILESMISAIIPVANAFVVLLIFSSLFAVMAVMFFKVASEHQSARKSQGERRREYAWA